MEQTGTDQAHVVSPHTASLHIIRSDKGLGFLPITIHGLSTVLRIWIALLNTNDHRCSTRLSITMDIKEFLSLDSSQ